MHNISTLYDWWFRIGIKSPNKHPKYSNVGRTFYIYIIMIIIIIKLFTGTAITITYIMNTLNLYYIPLHP